jgi:hypothetical protein
VDDYYEEKVLADITEKGLKPGDLVGELADPNAPSAAALFLGPLTPLLFMCVQFSTPFFCWV